MPGPGFAVIDFETTGLNPSGHDRAIEVAIVHTNENGLIEGQWETLINPGRDLGRQDIHRIRAADIVSAPAFAQIAPALVELLEGRVVVAHNASFDTRFLIAELERVARPGESGTSIALHNAIGEALPARCRPRACRLLRRVRHRVGRRAPRAGRCARDRAASGRLHRAGE